MKLSHKPTKAHKAQKAQKAQKAPKKAANKTAKRSMSSARLPKRKYIDFKSKELLESVKAAKTDSYAPAQFFEVYKQATLTVPQFESVIKHPSTTPARKAEIMQSVLGHFKADAPTINFFTQLAQDGKLILAKDILTKYRKAAADANQDALATVISAAPLSKEQMDTISKALQGVTPKDHKLRVFSQIDPAIMGGLIIQMDEFYQDLSMISGYRVVEQKVVDATSV